MRHVPLDDLRWPSSSWVRVSVAPMQVWPQAWESWLRQEGSSSGVGCDVREPDGRFLVPAAKRSQRDFAVASGAPVTPGPGRYDDHECLFNTRYASDELAGALTERLASLRGRDDARLTLERLTGINDVMTDMDAPETLPDERVDELTDVGGYRPTEVHGVEQVLRQLKVARFRVVGPDDRMLLNMRSPFVHNALTKHKNVAAQVQVLAQQLKLPDQALDAAMLGLAGEVARPLTRAIAREVYESDVAMAGIAFDSRHDSSKLNVALFADRAELELLEEVPLSPDVREHVDAVRWALAVHELPVPPDWQGRTTGW